MGASAAGGSTRDYVNMLRKAAGAQFELVTGYKGTAEIGLAVERGEVDGLCGWDWSSLKAQKSDWLRDKKVNILVQISLEPEAELTKLGVPRGLEIHQERGRQESGRAGGEPAGVRPALRRARPAHRRKR